MLKTFCREARTAAGRLTRRLLNNLGKDSGDSNREVIEKGVRSGQILVIF